MTTIASTIIQRYHSYLLSSAFPQSDISYNVNKDVSTDIWSLVVSGVLILFSIAACRALSMAWPISIETSFIEELKPIPPVLFGTANTRQGKICCKPRYQQINLPSPTEPNRLSYSPYSRKYVIQRSPMLVLEDEAASSFPEPAQISKNIYLWSTADDLRVSVTSYAGKHSVI